MKTLLLTTDLTPRVDRVFDRAAQLASSPGSKRTIVRVVDGGLLPDTYLKKNIKQAKEAWKRQVDEAAFPASVEVAIEVMTGKPHETIVTKARNANFDMIILGVPHG